MCSRFTKYQLREGISSSLKNIHTFLKEEHKHVNLTEAPDHIPDLSGEDTAAVLGVLHTLGVNDGDTLPITQPTSRLPYCLKKRNNLQELKTYYKPYLISVRLHRVSNTEFHALGFL